MSNEGPTDLRGYQPERKPLTWRLALRAVSLYTTAFAVAALPIRLLFLTLPPAAQPWSALVTVVVITVVSMTVLEPWFRRQVGLTSEAERRERTWAASHQMFTVAGRQAFRLLALEWPVFVLSWGLAELLVTVVFRVTGVHASTE